MFDTSTAFNQVQYVKLFNLHIQREMCSIMAGCLVTQINNVTSNGVIYFRKCWESVMMLNKVEFYRQFYLLCTYTSY